MFEVLGFHFGLFVFGFDALQHLHASGVAVVAMRRAEILVSEGVRVNCEVLCVAYDV